ncbi:metallophosphoesterase family protein [Cupriavidus basilensis]
MRAIIFSDIHGNLPALEKMLADAGRADRYICLGDIVNYGPWSNECVDLVFSLPNCSVIEGNHEANFKNNNHISSNISKIFFDFCRPNFDRYEKISKLPEKIEWEGYTFAHTIKNRKIYPDTDLSLDANYMIGHSHHQFKTENSGFILYNCGSVGQNRLYINIINYLVFHTDEHIIEMRSTTYDEMLVINEMRQRGYPRECIDYYNDKQRLN